MLDSRCLASLAPSQTVIYPLTSVDWVWISGGMAEMERAEGRGLVLVSACFSLSFLQCTITKSLSLSILAFSLVSTKH